MSVYESIIQGLTEAADYQQGKIHARKTKLAALRQLSQELIDLNKTDPLPPEFDEILSQRLQFRELASVSNNLPTGT